MEEVNRGADGAVGEQRPTYTCIPFAALEKREAGGFQLRGERYLSGVCRGGAILDASSGSAHSNGCRH
jgi:hypothetical protein